MWWVLVVGGGGGLVFDAVCGWTFCSRIFRFCLWFRVICVFFLFMIFVCV